MTESEKGIIVDIGTGDGKFVYDLAKKYPERFFIGIDPHAKGVEKLSLKATKKPAKGGLLNVLYVMANVEDLPKEMNGVANEVHINFPWGSLLTGVARPDEKVLANIVRIAEPGAELRILLSYNRKTEPAMMEKYDLPELTFDHIDNTLKPIYVKHGIEIVDRRVIEKEELGELPSSWGKKMLHGKDREIFEIRAIIKK